MERENNFSLPPHVLAIYDSLREEPISTTKETKLFDMLVPVMESLIPCEVWAAEAEGDISFTRVVLYPGTEFERLVDMDRTEDGWIDVYSCEATPWTLLLGPAINLRAQEELKNED